MSRQSLTPVTLPADPTNPLEATTKQYVDAQVAAVTAGGVPAGVVVPYAGSTAPTGWLLCDGFPVSRTTYATLFAAIGTAYGAGDGSTTFHIPNLTGRVPIGRDGADTDFDTLGDTGGSKTATLAATNLPTHVHSLGNHQHGGDTGGESVNHTHGASVQWNQTSAGGSNQFRVIDVLNQTGASGGSSATGQTGGRSAGHTHTIPAQQGDTGSGTGLNGTAIPIVPKFLTLNYLIKT